MDGEVVGKVLDPVFISVTSRYILDRELGGKDFFKPRQKLYKTWAKPKMITEKLYESQNTVKQKKLEREGDG